MIKYDNYKPSGIDWLGDIPEHWNIIRIKDYTYVKARIGWQGLRSDEFTENTSWFCVTGTDFKNGTIDWSNCYCVEKERFDQDKKIQLHINDLLITKDGSIGKIALINTLPKLTTLNSGVFVTRPLQNKYSNNFMFWLMISSVFTKFNDFTKNGSTILHLYQNVFERFSFCIPPIPEQSAIATYLDTKTQAIDKKIEILTKKTNNYKELRKSLINQTVCRGLDKNVKLKDSGIEWIGKIPEHWQVNRLKSLGCIETSSVNKKIEENEGLVKLVNYTDIYNNPKKEIWNDDSYMVVSANIKQLKSKKLQQGNVLFTPSSETIEDIGVSAVVMEDLENTLYSYHILRFKFQKDIFLNFKKYLLNNDFVQYYFSKSASGTTRKILGLNIFYNLPVLLPPTIEEQTQIANFLDQKTQIIDSIVNNIQKQIAVLKELRKTLINDAVTGKIKVMS